MPCPINLGTPGSALYRVNVLVLKAQALVGAVGLVLLFGAVLS